jgi:hypothetical protein
MPCVAAPLDKRVKLLDTAARRCLEQAGNQGVASTGQARKGERARNLQCLDEVMDVGFIHRFKVAPTRFQHARSPSIYRKLSERLRTDGLGTDAREPSIHCYT